MDRLGILGARGDARAQLTDHPRIAAPIDDRGEAGPAAAAVHSGYVGSVDADQARETIAARAPRRLRLDELLRELGASDGERPPHTADGQPPAADGQADGQSQPVQGEPAARPETLTVGALVDKAAEAGFGFLIGVLTLIAIPFVGLSTPFGLAIALLGAQLMIGLGHPWLPARARRRALSMSMLDRVLGILARRTRWLARLSRRRWELVVQPRLIGLGIVLLALGLALPLPIPGSNMIFLVPLFVYSIGVLERDGLWILLGHLGTLIDMAALVVLGREVAAVFVRAWHWLF